MAKGEGNTAGGGGCMEPTEKIKISLYSKEKLKESTSVNNSCTFIFYFSYAPFRKSYMQEMLIWQIPVLCKEG